MASITDLRHLPLVQHPAPPQRHRLAFHCGPASADIEERQHALLAAYPAHPERFVRKPFSPSLLPEAVWTTLQNGSRERSSQLSPAIPTSDGTCLRNIDKLPITARATMFSRAARLESAPVARNENKSALASFWRPVRPRAFHPYPRQKSPDGP